MFDEQQFRIKDFALFKSLTVLVILVGSLLLPGLIIAQNPGEPIADEQQPGDQFTDQQNPGEGDIRDKAVKGIAMVGIGAGATALGVYIFNQSDSPDCSGASYSTDPQTGKSPYDTCKEEQDEEDEEARTGATFVFIGVAVFIVGLFNLGSAAVDAVTEAPPPFKTQVSLAPCLHCRLPGIQVAWSYRWN